MQGGDHNKCRGHVHIPSSPASDELDIRELMGDNVPQVYRRNPARHSPDHQDPDSEDSEYCITRHCRNPDH